MADHPYNELGRRLKAAVISYKMRYAGVDRTLKDLPATVDPSWAELGETLDTQMQEKIERMVFGGNLAPSTTRKVDRDQTGPDNTERVILKDLDRVKHTSLNSTILKVIHTFTGAPAPEYGVASCFVSAPDEVIRELHTALDRAISEVFALHVIEESDNPPVSPRPN